MRVFNGASFESSSVRGESKPITIEFRGEPNLPANLVGLQGFTLFGPAGGESYTLTIPQGISTIANHLNHGGNTLAEILPNMPEGTLLYKYEPSRSSFSANHYQSGAWSRPQETLAPGEGAFIRNPGNEFTITFTGTKPSAQLPQLYRGYNFISLPVPGETSLPVPADGDSIFDTSSQDYRVSTFDGLENAWLPPLPGGLLTTKGVSFFYSARNPTPPVRPVDPQLGGTVYFITHLLGAVDARITWANGAGIGEGFTAQLYGGPAGTPVDQLVPLTPPTSFQTTSAAMMGYVKPVLVTPPGVSPGLPATLIMRVFDGSSFESSNIRGESKPITINVGGGTRPPANLVGLQGFSLPGSPPVGSQISVGRTADGLTLTYTGTLQSADIVTGPYVDVIGAASPVTIKFAGTARYYRLKP